MDVRIISCDLFEAKMNICWFRIIKVCFYYWTK